MIGDVVRLVADWLEDGTNGVGAMLANVPRQSGDPLPTTPAIQDETRDARPGRGRVPESGYPLLLVGAIAGVAIDENVVTDDGHFEATVAVRYVGQATAAIDVKRDGIYVLRAVTWSLRKLHRADVSHAGRTRNQIAVIRMGPITVEPWEESTADTLVAGAVTVQLKLRDSYAL